MRDSILRANPDDDVFVSCEGQQADGGVEMLEEVPPVDALDPSELYRIER